ncbi:MAG: ankyrin repeat domain-containing protein [Verrucomicrobiae bacterium]|nr:ankyrin repeat domain-containing protein [Verrucomicrobiae bacterium]
MKVIHLMFICAIIILAGCQKVDKYLNKNNYLFVSAGENGNNELINQILDQKKVDIDWQRADGDLNTALIAAARSEHEKTVLILLSRGANPNIQDINGWSAVHWAVEKNNTNLIQILASNKSNIDIKDIRGYTPLVYAVDHNKINAVILLIRLGASTNFFLGNGKSISEVISSNQELMSLIKPH